MADGCLDEHAALDYLAGAGDRAAIAAHADRCDDCRLLLLALARLEPSGVDHALMATAPAGSDRPAGSPDTASSIDPASIGRFVVLARLGAGAMGVVYHAEDPDLRRQVAIKVVRDACAGDAGRVRTMREAQAMAQLDHPNVIRVYEVGTDEAGEVFIAMEYVDGTTLARWIRTPRTWREIVDAFVQAGHGLAAAHTLGIVHRDFKPDNVMIDATGRVKVGDFGLARAIDTVDGEGTRSSPLATSMTQTGMLVGTPLYMSPEQLDGGPADARSDQFALCVAFYEALYDERPFVGATLAELRASTVQGPRAPAARGPAAALWPVLRRGLAPRRADRFADVGALLIAIERALRARRRRRFAGAAAIGALSVAAVGLAIAVREPPPPDPVAAVWSPAHAAKLREAMQRTSKRPAAFVTDQANRTIASIDRWLADWRTVSAAVAADREARPEIREHRQACLAHRLRVTGAAVAAITEARDDQVEISLPMLGAVGPPATCLATRPPSTPPPPEAVARITALATELGLAELRYQAGEVRSAIAVLDRLEPELRALRHAPLLAQALYLRGVAAEGTAARAALVEAAALSPSSGDVVLEIKILVSLVFDATYGDVDLALARTQVGAIEQARERVRQTGLPRSELDMMEAWLAAARASVASAERDYPRVVEHRERQYALMRSARGEHSRQAAQARASLGHALARVDRIADARVHLEGSIDALRETLGPDHPQVAEALIGFAKLQVALADLDAAHRAYERALAILSAAYGPKDPHRIVALTGLANLELTTGKLAEVVRRTTEVIELSRATYGEAASELTAPLMLLANAQLQLGNPTAARRAIVEVSAIDKRVHGPAYPGSVTYLATRAQIELAAGDYAAARTALETGLASAPEGEASWPLETYLAEIELIEGKAAAALARCRRISRELTTRYGDDYPILNFSVGCEGRALVGLGREHEALPVLERADARAKRVGARGPDVGAMRLALSRAIFRVRRDRARSLDLAKAAREELVLVEGQPGARAALADATIWLDRLARQR